MKTCFCALLLSVIVAVAEPIPDADAAKHVGETVELRGTVADVHVFESGQVVLNLGAKFPKQNASVVIPAKAASAFREVEELNGAEILAKGKIELFKDRPEIKITDPSSLQILKE